MGPGAMACAFLSAPVGRPCCWSRRKGAGEQLGIRGQTPQTFARHPRCSAGVRPHATHLHSTKARRHHPCHPVSGPEWAASMRPPVAHLNAWPPCGRPATSPQSTTTHMRLTWHGIRSRHTNTCSPELIRQCLASASRMLLRQPPGTRTIAFCMKNCIPLSHGCSHDMFGIWDGGVTPARHVGRAAVWGLWKRSTYIFPHPLGSEGGAWCTH